MAIYRGYNWYNSIFFNGRGTIICISSGKMVGGLFWDEGPLIINPIYTIGYHHFPFKSNETVKKKILKRIKPAHYNWRIVMIQKGKTNRRPIVSSYQCIVFKVVSTKYINNSWSTVEQCKKTSCLEYIGGGFIILLSYIGKNNQRL